jgi:predicted deacylase
VHAPRLPLLLALFLACAAGAEEAPPASAIDAGVPAADASAPDAPAPQADAATAADETAPPGGEPAWGALELLGETIPPGEARSIELDVHHGFRVAVEVLRGTGPGPTLCVVAGIHGDELNGVAIARRLVDETDPAHLLGTLVVAPIVNAHGFLNGSRYLPDRRDLNRHFPGRSRGSAASRIAHEFFERVVRRCDGIIDLHTGSFNRTNLPQIRADLGEMQNLRLAWGFGTEHVVHSIGEEGTLRRAAGEAGLAAVVYEAGEPLRFQPEKIELGVRGIRTLLESLGMLPGSATARRPQRHYHRTQWVRADASGIYIPTVKPGQRVERGQTLAVVTDPFSSRRSEIHAPRAGRVLGMALGQVVIPGFALFHLGEEQPGQLAVADPARGPSAEASGAAPLAGEGTLPSAELAEDHSE